MVFMRISDKRTYGKLIHDFYLQYAIKNDKYPIRPQEAVGVIHKVRFKQEKNNDKSNIQKQNKNEGGEQDKLNGTSFSKT